MRCSLCHSENPVRGCDECKSPVCKNCAVFPDKELCDFHPDPPKVLTHAHLCFQCFENEYAPLMAHYDEIFEKSKDVTVVSKAFRGLVPTLKKKHELVQVKLHLDEKIAVAHLKFLAAWEGWDAVVGMETVAKQVRRHGYEHSKWSAQGYFANLNKRRFRPDG